jgi:hypothetical protein
VGSSRRGPGPGRGSLPWCGRPPDRRESPPNRPRFSGRGRTAQGARASAGAPSTRQRVSSACPTTVPSGSSVTIDRPSIQASLARSASTKSASSTVGKAARLTSRIALTSSAVSGRVAQVVVMTESASLPSRPRRSEDRKRRRHVTSLLLRLPRPTRASDSPCMRERRYCSHGRLSRRPWGGWGCGLGSCAGRRFGWPGRVARRRGQAVASWCLWSLSRLSGCREESPVGLGGGSAAALEASGPAVPFRLGEDGLDERLAFLVERGAVVGG